MSALAAPAEHAPPPDLERDTPRGRVAGWRPPAGGRLRADALWWPTLLTAAILCFVAFYAGGGLRLGAMTTVEIVLTIGCGAIVAATVLLVPAKRPTYGLWALGLLFALAALTALSVIWSVQPDESFKDAGRMFAYVAVFGAALALARAAPTRWPAVLGGVTLAAVVVCGYALLTKVLPGQLDANDVYARLRAPYDYWNATGLTAAMGVICCLWLGARRAGHAVLSALAYPAMGLMLVTLMLAYSRGALVALAFGLLFWFCLVPLRLRGAAVLLAGGCGAALVVAWDFSTNALSTEDVALATRVTAGRQLGALLVAMLILLTIVGLAVGFITARRAPSRRLRTRAGAALLTILAVVVIAAAGALAVSHRGLPGSVSHAFHTLTDTNAKVSNTPGRLTAIASVRARYWKEAFEVFEAHPVLGAGAEGYRVARLRYRNAPLEVRHAHGFLVQTLADLGLVGLTLALALLVAWMVAAGRATHPFNRRWTGWRTLRGHPSEWRFGWRRAAAPYTPERIGLLSMLCLVVVFGVHSMVDWTWYVPGDACVALLCAGWLAGRGPLEPEARGEVEAAGGGVTDEQGASGGEGEGPMEDRGLTEDQGALEDDAESEVPRARPLRALNPVSATVACAVLIAALLAAWAQWQPQRSENASQEALALATSNPSAASAAALAAVSYDPLSVQALFTLSKVQQAGGRPVLARETLERAVRLQPSNPETWLHLGVYDLTVGPAVFGANAPEGGDRSALSELEATIYLNPESVSPEAIADGNPESIEIENDYVQAYRAAG
ncbi:MAG TPA: O-antigen ligase family protein [Solirubrobacteraceae bacterium]|nr:O-antigen ligase family protein [Solirubrobacteraceae bacterium]